MSLATLVQGASSTESVNLLLEIALDLLVRLKTTTQRSIVTALIIGSINSIWITPLITRVGNGRFDAPKPNLVQMAPQVNDYKFGPDNPAFNRSPTS